MLEAWRDNPTLELAEIEIINIEPKEQLKKNGTIFSLEITMASTPISLIVSYIGTPEDHVMHLPRRV
jgi:hypothetical protein